MHDVGKGESKLQQNQDIGKDEKEREGLCTIKRIESVSETLKIPEATLKIFRALLKYDSLGEYLKVGKLEVCISQLKEAARDAQIEYKPFLTLMDLYHNCDAGSYKNLSLRIFIYSSFTRVPHHQKLMNFLYQSN